MKNINLLLAWFPALSCIASFSHAEPVQFDTDDAHVIVIRPVDTWSGNSVTNEYTLAGIKSKKSQFSYVDSNGKKMVGFISESIFPWNKELPNDEVIHKVANEFARLGFTLNGQFFFVESPITVQPSDMPTIIAAQESLFKKLVINQGNPTTLPDRIHNKRLGGMLVNVALLLVGADKIGTVASSNIVLSSGLSNDVTRLTTQELKSLTAVSSVPFDYSQYRSVDIRKIVPDLPDRVGQIIIAYKGEKTKQAEEIALAQAIVTASGADTTIEKIEKSRKEDMVARQAIWDECVAKGECKSE